MEKEKSMKAKKLPYDNAKLEVVKFSGADVIATSGESQTSGDWSNVDTNGGDWS